MELLQEKVKLEPIKSEMELIQEKIRSESIQSKMELLKEKVKLESMESKMELFQEKVKPESMESKMELLKEKIKLEVINSDYAENILVFGEGKENAKICMIGEAPGAEEEKQGKPFVGRAGKILWDFLEMTGLKREQIYITNVVKFRPTDKSKTGRTINRIPKKAEIDFFLPYLTEELMIVQPDIIVTLGNVPLKAVTGEESAMIGAMHGTMTTTKHGYQLFPLYHPASIIYNSGLAQTYQDDLRALKQYL